MLATVFVLADESRQLQSSAGRSATEVSQAPRDHVYEAMAAWRNRHVDIELDGFEISARVIRLGDLIGRAVDEALTTLGIKQADLTVLAALNRGGPPYIASPSRLNNVSLVSSGSMSHRLKRLEEASLIIRETNPSDGRGIIVRLTEGGKRIVAQGMQTQARINGSMFGHLDDEERVQLARLLQKVLAPIDPPSPTSFE